MDPTLVPAVVLLTLVVALAVSFRDPPSFLRQLRDQLDQLGHELDRRIDRDHWARRLPVFSAQTVRGKEAEFLRDRLPRKLPRARFVVLLFLIGVFAWWFARELV